MCIRTVEGEDIVESSLRTIDGEYSSTYRNISGIVSSSIVLLGTIPTMTVIDTSGSGTYTSPLGCVYFEVYILAGSGGGGGGGAGTDDRYGGGGAGGNLAFGIFLPGTYSYSIGTGGTGAVAGADGTNGVSSTFGLITAGFGPGGDFCNNPSASNFPPAVNSSTNSLIDFGNCRAGVDGPGAAWGGMNMFMGGGGREVSSSSNLTGEDGFFGGGAGGINNTGGNGATGRMLIIEYY